MKSKTLNRYIIFLLILTTFSNFFFNAVPITVFGISLYLFLFLALIFIIFLLKIKTQSKFDVFIYLLFLLIFVFFSSLRFLAYNSEANFLSYLLNHFSFYLPPILLMITSSLNILFFKKLKQFLIIILLIQAVLSVLFILGLPTINLLTENHLENYRRYVGIMSGANVNANFNSLIVAVLLLSPNNYTFSKKILVIVLGIISVLPSFTQLAFAIIFLLFVYEIFNFIKKKTSISVWLLIPILIIPLFLLINDNISNLRELRTIDRIIYSIEFGGDGVRSSKYLYGISVLFENFTSFFIGPPQTKQIGNFIEFSDNSFIQMPLNLGVPLFILFILLMIKFSKFLKQKITLNLIVFLSIIHVTLLLNNAIFWIPWLFVASIGYWSIAKTKNKKNNLVISE